MTYGDRLTGNPDEDFALFTGAAPAPDALPAAIEAVVEFFKAHFSAAAFDPNGDEDDAVISFCQTHPAGNYGHSLSALETAHWFPGYGEEIEETINAAWLIQLEAKGF